MHVCASKLMLGCWFALMIQPGYKRTSNPQDHLDSSFWQLGLVASTWSSKSPIFGNSSKWIAYGSLWLVMVGFRLTPTFFSGLNHCLPPSFDLEISGCLAPHQPLGSWSHPTSSWSWPPLLGPKHPGKPGDGSHTMQRSVTLFPWITPLLLAAPSSIAFFIASNCLTLLVWFSPSLANKYTSCGRSRHQSVCFEFRIQLETRLILFPVIWTSTLHEPWFGDEIA